jgi:putative ABC transport system permease protein
MFRHYLKTALRFLRRNSLYTAINALGLSISLAVSFIILMFVINEFSYNHGHRNRSRIFRVVTYYKEFKNTMAGSPYVLAKTLKEEYPQVEKATNMRNLRGFQIKQSDEYVPISRAKATDSDVFDIFTIPLIGATLSESPLEDLHSIVLSEKLAERFFPGEDAVGRELEVLVNNAEEVFVVSGVYEDIPRNSTFQADCMVNGRWSLAPLNQTFGITNIDLAWEHNFWNTWILLSEASDAGAIDEQFEAFGEKHISKDPPFQYSLQNLKDYYLGSGEIANTWTTGNLKNIQLFSTIAFLIVLIAAINYIILSVAVSTGRAKEIGIRKASGASVRKIRNQLLGEFVILSILVLPLALILMELASPLAEKLFQTSLEMIPSNLVVYIPVYLGLTVLIGLVSGLYASSFLSRLKVLDVLKQKVSFGSRRKFYRSVLIVIQLVIFCAFVSSTLIIRSQYQYALKKDPGHHNKEVLQVDLPRGFQAYNALLEGIRSLPEVISAAGSMDGLPMGGWMTFMHPHFQNQEEKVKLEGFAVDYGLIETMGMTLLEGRSFSAEFGNDLNRSVILNETAVRALGIGDPVGQYLMDSSRIIGVVKDFNLHSIHNQIPPLVISMTDKYLHHILIHYHTGNLDELVAKLKTEWEKVEGDQALNYSTIEDLFIGVYSEEKNLGTILSLSALFALLIATFGLFGLTLFVARSRTHEIGVRKVFGSSGDAIVYSFLWSNLLMVVVAAIISIPLTLYFMSRWLSNFPYRVGIEWWVFAVSFLMATLVVLATVYIQSRKASRVNPVEALRYE